VGTFLLEDLENYRDTQMKAYDITDLRLTAEMKSDNMQYRNKKKLYYCCGFALVPSMHNYFCTLDLQL